MEQTLFDRDRYRELSRRQWEETAQGWHRWTPWISEWQRPAIELAFELAGIGEGSRVLEVAGGDGSLSLQMARRVGEPGYVLCTDIAANMVDLVARAAAHAGLAQIESRVMDAENLTLEDGSFDAVLCMVSLMLFADPQKALSEAHRVLRDGGSMVAVVFTTPDRSPIFAVPARIALEYAGRALPQPGQPGLFALGEEGRLEGMFRRAGFRDVESRTIGWQVELQSAAEAARMVRETAAAIRGILAGVEESRRREAWQVIEQGLKSFEKDSGFVSPCEFGLVAGTR